MSNNNYSMTAQATTLFTTSWINDQQQLNIIIHTLVFKNQPTTCISNDFNIIINTTTNNFKNLIQQHDLTIISFTYLAHGQPLCFINSQQLTIKSSSLWIINNIIKFFYSTSSVIINWIQAFKQQQLYH